MTSADDSTMAASEAAGSSFKEVSRSKKSKRLKPTPVQKIPVQRTHNYNVRVYFPMPRAHLKFNPSTSMQLLFIKMLKYDSTLTVANEKDDQQIQLTTDAVLQKEEEFKKYFTVMSDPCPTGNKPHIIVGCKLMSNRSLRDIKFDMTTSTKFIDWLKKEQIFLESDLLGISKTSTIGYLTKIHPRITNHMTLKNLLSDEIADIVLDPAFAVELDPSLKQQQVDAMSNGDMFVPAPPPFELYPTTISCGRDRDKVETDVIGIKCAAGKGRLLKEFFLQIGTPMELDTRMGVFVPTGAIHMIGPADYTKLLCKNNAFLQSIVTVPIGDFQHETLEIPFSCDTTTDIDATDLYETIVSQPWCLSLERTTTPNKVLLVTTKSQVNAARDWVDHTLPALYQTHVADKLDVTTLKQMTPRRLDKPFLTAASLTYAEKLKLRASYATPTAPNPTQFNHPPKAKYRKPADVTFVPQQQSTQQTRTANLSTQQTTTSAKSPPATPATATPAFDYQAELKRISHEIETNLKAKLDAAINNLQATVTALESKIEQKFNQHIEAIKATQADKTTQDNHSRELEEITKQLGFLVSKVSLLVDLSTPPASFKGVGRP